MQNPNPNLVKAQLAVVAEFLSGIGTEASQPAILALLAKLQTAESAEVATENAEPGNWTVTAGAMTNAQYVAHRGLCCPSCGSTDISGNDLDADDTGAWQAVHCKDCGAEWQDSFTLTGYTDLEGGINSDNIAAVLEDVKDRGERYGFNVDDTEQAVDCVDGSAEILGITLSDAEKKLAVEQLTS